MFSASRYCTVTVAPPGTCVATIPLGLKYLYHSVRPVAVLGSAISKRSEPRVVSGYATIRPCSVTTVVCPGKAIKIPRVFVFVVVTEIWSA